MSMKFAAILLLFATMPFYLTAEVLTKRWSLSPSWTTWAGIMFMYALCGSVWALSVRCYSHIAVMNAIWSCIGVVGVVLIGTIGFGEVIETKQWIGIGLSIIAIALLSS